MFPFDFRSDGISVPGFLSLYGDDFGFDGPISWLPDGLAGFVESCSRSLMAPGEWMAGVRSLTTEVLVSRISCGLPMHGLLGSEGGGSTM